MATNLFFKSAILSIFVVFLPSSFQKPFVSTAKPTSPYIGAAVCQLPLEPGVCLGFFPRWYYNHKTKQCQQFIYGGCGGNNNHFISKAACLLTCHARVGSQGLKVPLLPTSQPKVTTISKESRKKIDIKPNKSRPVLPPLSKNQTAKVAQPCEIEKQKALDLNQSGIFIPECDDQGNYKTMQCWMPLGLKEASCWCVDKDGRKTGEVKTTSQGKNTCEKISLANSPCIKALKQALDASILLQGMPIPINVFGRSYVPECDLNTGLFKPQQCHKTNCWCVNTHTGAEINNTYGVKGSVKCSD